VVPARPSGKGRVVAVAIGILVVIAALFAMALLSQRR